MLLFVEKTLDLLEYRVFKLSAVQTEIQSAPRGVSWIMLIKGITVARKTYKMQSVTRLNAGNKQLSCL